MPIRVTKKPPSQRYAAGAALFLSVDALQVDFALFTAIRFDA